MLKKMLFLIAGMLLSVNSSVQAQDLIQISDTQTWANFDEGGFGAGDTLQIMAGGNLTITGRSRVQDGRHLIVEEGGRFTINARLDTNSQGVITMNGGEFYANVDFKFPDNAGNQDVHIWLHGGLMVCAQIQSMMDRGSVLHVGGGILRVGNTGAGGDWDPENADEWAIVPIPPYPNVIITDIGGGWKEIWAESPVLAYDPNPADGATDVVRDPTSNPIVLSWTPSVMATKRDVYFGTDIDAISNAERGNPLDVLKAEGQIALTYNPGTLEYGQTYYWRIDEVNDAETDSPWKGDVWRFTVEPYSYLIENLTATASSSLNADYGPERTIDGSGLNDQGEHSADMLDMWVSDVETEGAWIQYVFEDIYKLDLMRVWNFNTAFEDVLGWGPRDVTIEQTDDGTNWSVLGDVTFNQGISADNYAANTVIELDSILTRGLRLNARNNWGDLIDLYGLSEVQLFRIIGNAREPQPADGAEGLNPGSILAWRVGREAEQHRISLGDSMDNLALVDTVNENNYDPSGLDLKLGQTYFWRVDEVNEAEIPSLWEGDIWRFSTTDYLVVDDFEDYDVGNNEIWWTWKDGLGYVAHDNEPAYPGNGSGSAVGDENSPSYMEETIIHGGGKSLPFYYGLNNASDSWATCTFEEARDWTRSGVKVLVLYFHGVDTNKGGKLYVEINNKRIDYPGDASDLTKLIWTQWVIELTSENVNPQSVQTLTIGVEGIGSSGVLYIDDIRLYAEAPAVATE